VRIDIKKAVTCFNVVSLEFLISQRENLKEKKQKPLYSVTGAYVYIVLWFSYSVYSEFMVVTLLYVVRDTTAIGFLKSSKSESIPVMNEHFRSCQKEIVTVGPT
jgi:hypothetical protein